MQKVCERQIKRKEHGGKVKLDTKIPGLTTKLRIEDRFYNCCYFLYFNMVYFLLLYLIRQFEEKQDERGKEKDLNRDLELGITEALSRDISDCCPQS